MAQQTKFNTFITVIYINTSFSNPSFYLNGKLRDNGIKR